MHIQTKSHIRVGIIREYLYAKTIPWAKNSLQQTYPQICTQMPVDTWLIGYLLSFGTQVKIIESTYLKNVLAKQGQAIY